MIKKYLEFLNEQEQKSKLHYNEDITIPKDSVKIPEEYRDSIVNGHFSCNSCTSLTSLEGAPKVVEGNFDCRECISLTSLKGSPKVVKGDFYCWGCPSLTSLEGAPKVVEGYFSCGGCNSLTSLEGAPKVVEGYFTCSHCNSLTSLEGAPKKPSNYFRCHCTEAYNSLGSLYTDETQKLSWTHACALAFQGIYNGDYHRLMSEGLSQDAPEELKEKLLSLKHRYRGKDTEVLKLLGYNEMFYDDVISKRNIEEEVW